MKAKKLFSLSLIGFFSLLIVAQVGAFGRKWFNTNRTCPDKNGNGICDGLEDFDNDGVTNREDNDYMGTNSINNPYFIDENENGICDYRENGTTALGGIGKRGKRW